MPTLFESTSTIPLSFSIFFHLLFLYLRIPFFVSVPLNSKVSLPTERIAKHTVQFISSNSHRNFNSQIFHFFFVQYPTPIARYGRYEVTVFSHQTLIVILIQE